MAGVSGRAGSAAGARTPKRKTSRIWWHVHQWVGFKLSLLMGFILLTGTLAVLSAEIDWLIHPSLRVAPASVDGEPDWARIVEGAAREPGVAALIRVVRPTATAFAARMTVDYTDGTLGYLHIHPTTGVVQGRQGFVDAQRVLRNMHRHLNLPADYGVPLVTALSFLLLTSVITSMLVYKKWWRGFLKWPRTRDARTWWGDFHRLSGVWTLWFAALIALTSIWYFVESVGGEAPALPQAAVEGVDARPRGIAKLFPASLEAARRADAALRIDIIDMSDIDDGAFVFEGEKTSWLVRPRANAVHVDAIDSRIMLVSDARTLGVHQRISEMADPLHFGTFAGYWSKLPWFLFGLLMTGLALSGVAIYGLRIGRQIRQALPTHRGLAIAWRAMGHWRWPALTLILTSLALIPELLVASN